MQKQFVHIDISVSVPGLDQPIKLDQWVPVNVRAHSPMIVCPAASPGRRSSEIEVSGNRRSVAPSVHALLREIAAGAESVKFRPETQRRIERDLPELMDGLTRDHDRKVVNKLRTWIVKGWLHSAVVVR